MGCLGGGRVQVGGVFDVWVQEKGRHQECAAGRIMDGQGLC